MCRGDLRHISALSLLSSFPQNGAIFLWKGSQTDYFDSVTLITAAFACASPI